MKKAVFAVEMIKDNRSLGRLVEIMADQSEFALDIETTEWWNRQREKVSLIQLAYRQQSTVKVAVIDAFADLGFDSLRSLLESDSVVKVVHNASFDVPRLAKHYAINAVPVFDTMRAARKSGERKYSLSAQSFAHLNLYLDKSAQRSDWSRRPLAAGQIYYAAVDAYAALLLYENQISRGVTDGFQNSPVDFGQISLPLSESPQTEISLETVIENQEKSDELILPDISLTLLGIVTELPTRYSPDALAASVGSERIGLAGWIIDRRLGADVDLDEETVKLAIADLCERNFVRLNDTRRLIATDTGNDLWKKFRNY